MSERVTEVTQEALQATVRPADTARLFGVDGKRLRDKLRKMGVYVSQGHPYTPEHRTALAEAFGVTIANAPKAKKVSATK